MNKIGNLTININTKNLMCPGQMNANYKLVLELIIITNRLIVIVK